MTAHQMVPGILNLHLAPYWPRAVQTVFLRWQNGINQLADILAHQHTTEPAAHPIDNDRRALLIRAYVIALGLAD